MVKLDESLIDELVAGDLQGQAYREVLRKLDSEPDGWKKCALAFLEEQALTRDLGSLSGDDQIWMPNSESYKLEDKDPAGSGSSQLASVSSLAHSRLEWLSRLTSLAAMLLISFTVGWFGAGLRGVWWTNDSASSVDGLAVTVPGGASSNSRQMPSAGYEIPDNGGNGFPAADPARLQYVGDDLIPFNQKPPEYLKELQRSGKIDLESFDALVPVYEDDVLRLVPLQHFRVRQKVFSY